jgi:cation:H+ antiporter
MDLGEGAVGSVFAAVGTALPETMIPVIAILFGSGARSHSVGVGAVLGAPFMLGTLALAVTGIVVLLTARQRISGEQVVVRQTVVAHDVQTFVLAYAWAIALALLPGGWAVARALGAGVLVIGYLWYVRQHLREDADEDAELPEPLRFHRFDRHQHRLNTHDPRVRMVLLQVLFAIGLIIAGASLFVGAVEALGSRIGMDEAILALLVAPIATELPEAVNAVIWIRQGKDTLAIGNITGALVFQATIPTSIALLFAPELWLVDGHTLAAFASALVAFASVGLISIPMIRRGRLMGRGLLVGAIFYVGYVVTILVLVVRPA